MATIAELTGHQVEAEPAAAFDCPRCGWPVPVTCEWRPLAVAPGRLPAYRLVHRKPGGGECVVYAGGPLSEGGQDR